MDIKNNEFVSIGMDLGIYTMAKLIAGGMDINKEAWAALGAQAAASIQNATDMPAEDISLAVQPIVDRMLEQIK